MKLRKRKLINWLTELRAPFLTATLVSIFLGTAIAWTRNDLFNLEYFLLTLLGGTFLHLGANVANDYFDHKSGNDRVNKEFVRPFSGGSRMIQLGLLSPREVLFGALLFYASATLIGLYLAWARGWFIMALGLIGIFSGFFYTAPPFNWASKAIGEALVGINFGTLMTLGSYYVQTGQLSLEPVIASIPVSLLIAAVLYINEFPDYVADKAVGKNTIVVRLGPNRAAYGYALIIMGAYSFLFLNILFGITPPNTFFALITLPLAVSAAKFALKYHSNPSSLVPANALTTVCHFLASLLISLGYISHRFEVQSPIYLFITLSFGICALITGHFFLKTRSNKSSSISSPESEFASLRRINFEKIRD